MLKNSLRALTIHFVIYLLLTAGINTKAQAQSINNSVNSQSQPNQEQSLDNDQRNSAAINQTGVYNIGDSATYKIQGLSGRQVVCPKPSLILGTSYSSFNGISFSDNASYGVNAAFVIPLGGSLEKTCKQMAETISIKTKYDLEIINARACTELIRAGVRLNPDSFPTLSNICEGVSIGRNNTNEPKNVKGFQSQGLPKYEPEKDK